MPSAAEPSVEERARKVCDKLGPIPHTDKAYHGICFVCQYTEDAITAAVRAQKERDAELCEVYDPENVVCPLCGAGEDYCCRGTADKYEVYTYHGVRWAAAIRAQK